MKKMKKIVDLVRSAEAELKDEFEKLDELCLINSKKVLDAFHKYKLSESDFNVSSGYGYNDIGRDKIENIYASIFGSEDALVRSQIVSGSHALTIGLQGILRPNDKMVSITGTPYDTLHEVIGIRDSDSSLMSYNVVYEEIDLTDDGDFDYESIRKVLVSSEVKMIYIQRSRGYSLRNSIDICKLRDVIKFIRNISSSKNNGKDVIIFVDNCYCEFVEELSPIEVGASICAGSLIKNLGAGIASNGGYLAGSRELIKLCSERLYLPGEGKEVGPTSSNKMFLEGLYFAPSVVCSALKTALLTSKMFEYFGVLTSPKYNEARCDIVLLIHFNDVDKLVRYSTLLQSSGCVDAHVSPVAGDMPGYDCKVIMASPSFQQGSSIELSCDAPLRSPYVLFQQGSLTYEYGKLAVINIFSEMYGEGQ